MLGFGLKHQGSNWDMKTLVPMGAFSILAVWPWSRHFTSLILHSLVSEMGRLGPVQQGPVLPL